MSRRPCAPIVLNAARGVELIPYLVTEKKRLSFLIAPGGGYTNCDPKESAPVAKAFNRRGYNCYILKYSVGEHRQWPHPLEDFDAAMDYLTSHSEELFVDSEHIVGIGFSAGGHVIAAAASCAKQKPFAAVLCYALIDRETLSYCNPGAPDAAELVNDDTCPCFLASSRNDGIVPISNTTKLIEAFQQHFVGLRSPHLRLRAARLFRRCTSQSQGAAVLLARRQLGG